MKLSKLKELAIRFLAAGPVEDYIDKDWLLKQISTNVNTVTDISTVPCKELIANQEKIKDLQLVQTTTDLSIIPTKELIEVQENKAIKLQPKTEWEKAYLEMLNMDRYLFWDDIFYDVQKRYLTNTTNINDLFTKKVEGLSLFEIENQAFQLVNYMNNMTIRGNNPIVSLMTNCNMVLKRYINDTDANFNESLDNTVYVFNAQYSYEYNGYEEYIRNLRPNDKKSFIVAPITSNNHLFSMVFYKKSDECGKIYYEAIVVNKGDRPGHTYEKYKFSEENIGTIAEMLGYGKNVDFSTYDFGIYDEIPNLTTRQLYDKFKEYAINNEYEVLDNIVAQSQIVGNCFYKEVEAGLKFAYSNAYDTFEAKVENGKVVKTPKWPIETEKFNKELLDNVKDILVEHLKDDKVTLIDDVIDDMDNLVVVYDRNKKIRRILKNNEEFTTEKLDEIFDDIVGFENEREVNAYIWNNLDFKTKMMLSYSHENLEKFLNYFREKIIPKVITDLICVNEVNKDLSCIDKGNTDLACINNTNKDLTLKM